MLSDRRIRKNRASAPCHEAGDGPGAGLQDQIVEPHLVSIAAAWNVKLEGQLIEREYPRSSSGDGESHRSPSRARAPAPVVGTRACSAKPELRSRQAGGRRYGLRARRVERAVHLASG